MDLRHVLAAFHRWRVVMFMILLLAIGAASAYATVSPPTYTSETTVYFTLNKDAAADALAQSSAYTQDAAQSYSQVVTLPMVLDPVIQSLQLDLTAPELARQISVRTPPGSVLTTIRVASDDAQLATRIANAVSRQLDTAVLGLSSRAGPASPGAVRVQVASAATTPERPTSPNIPLVLGLGGVVGLVLAAGSALLLNRLTSPLIDDEDIERGFPIIGKIAWDKRARPQPLPILSHPGQARAECFRSLRTNLRHLHEMDAAACLVVTSALPREGRTSVAVNLALSIAQSHRRVLLIDADLRHPTVAKRLGLETDHGLSDVLLGEQQMENAIRSMSAETWKDDTVLDVLSAGRRALDPAELFARPLMTDVLDNARKRYDIVIIDAPPLLPVTDAALLAAQADGALLVVNAGTTTERDFAEAQKALRLAGAHVHGVVVNAATIRRRYRRGFQQFSRRS